MSNRGANSFDCEPRCTTESATGGGSSRYARLARSLLPLRCELCAARTGGPILCAECTAKLPHALSACPVCALPSPHNATCGACLRDPPPFVGTLAAFVYGFPVDRLIHAAKYGGRYALAHWAGSCLAIAVCATLDRRDRALWPQRIVALPLAVNRQRERGYNQAALIASHAARATSLPIVAPIERIGGNVPQTALPWRERRRNVRGAFAAREQLQGVRVALVDDVMTTGATLAEAARALRTAGAARVECWVVARTPAPDQG